MKIKVEETTPAPGLYDTEGKYGGRKQTKQREEQDSRGEPEKRDCANSLGLAKHKIKAVPAASQTKREAVPDDNEPATPTGGIPVAARLMKRQKSARTALHKDGENGEAEDVTESYEHKSRVWSRGPSGQSAAP